MRITAALYVSLPGKREDEEDDEYEERFLAQVEKILVLENGKRSKPKFVIGRTKTQLLLLSATLALPQRFLNFMGGGIAPCPRKKVGQTHMQMAQAIRSHRPGERDGKLRNEVESDA